MRPLVPASMLAVCAIVIACNRTPDEVGQFEYDKTWTERIADPGIVDVACRSKTDEGVCGCADFDLKIVWLSRRIECSDHRDKTRKHEACHVATGSSAAAVKACHDKFPPETVFNAIRRS